MGSKLVDDGDVAFFVSGVCGGCVAFVEAVDELAYRYHHVCRLGCDGCACQQGDCE